MRIAVIIACILVLFSCQKRKGATANTTSAPVQETPAAPDAPVAQQDSLLYEYKRGACFGTCPIFNLKIY